MNAFLTVLFFALLAAVIYATWDLRTVRRRIARERVRLARINAYGYMPDEEWVAEYQRALRIARLREYS